MKKELFISFFLVFYLPSVLAQEPAICGDWIGVYKDASISDDVDSEGSKYFIQKDYRRYIRVKLIDGHYTVRMKTRIADESSPFTYSPECQIIEANDRIIKWKMDMGPSYDWSLSDKRKGISIGHADYFIYCTAVLSNGTLKYSEYMLTTYYDRQGREIDRQKWFEKDGQSLYKDDSDW